MIEVDREIGLAVIRVLWTRGSKCGYNNAVILVSE